MQIRCPHCGHTASTSDLKPGRYKPKCNKCTKRFAMVVSSDPAAAPQISFLEEAAATIAPAAATEATMAPMSSAPLSSTPTPTQDVNATGALDPNATGAFVTNPTTALRTSMPATANATMDFSAKEQTVGAAASAPRPSIQATAVNPPGGKTINEGAASANVTTDIPEVLGGYRLIKELGRGAMGAVYLAKQISLDRNVALKVIQSQWAKNPTFIARFVREAYAAAQLTHHNVVQIYDLGTQGDTNYFSMEFVNGESLSDLIEKNGKLDPEQAVGYILQAARGLSFAHNHGMVHRDVKPANMMLNDQGVVKVADLGLVKTPQVAEETATASTANASPSTPGGKTPGGTSIAAATANVTQVDIAMGTPAYMAPEQAENAAGVDHRADIYSLGCTLYVLLTGKPPFEGATAMEVITKHRTEPVIRPDVVVKRIPPALSDIVLKMIAKRPEDRYQNVDELIKDCERFLGIQSTGPLSPSEAQAQTLEDSQRKFNAAKWAGIRTLAIQGILGGSAALAFLSLFGFWSLSAMFALLGLSFGTVYFAVSGFRARTFLFGKCREYLASLRISDWLTTAISVLLGVLILFLTNWLWLGIVGIILGAGLALAVHFVIDAKVDAERKEPLDALEGMLKSMRLKGIDEQAIQTFIAKYSSDHWEELFEALFGYEAKLIARAALERNPQGKPRPKFRAWRERLIGMIDNKLKADREARDRKTLQKVEEANLKAQGMDEMQARRRAAQVAEALVEDAAEQRQATMAMATQPIAASPMLDPKVIAAQKRAKQLALLNEARSGKYTSKRKIAVTSLFTGPLGFALSGKVRFLAGVALLTLLAMAVQKSGAVADVTNAASGDMNAVADKTRTALLGTKVTIPFVAEFSAIQVGTAGALLALLGLFRGWKMSFFAWPAAALALFGAGYLGGQAELASAAGAVVAVIGFFFGRSSD
jgi:serine/threonine protein kinase